MKNVGDVCGISEASDPVAGLNQGPLASAVVACVAAACRNGYVQEAPHWHGAEKIQAKIGLCAVRINP
ncbi:MAG: hypothetical protein AAGB22_12115 [Bacteroidota bacterium]